jgi:CRISPR-associated protein Csb2
MQQHFCITVRFLDGRFHGRGDGGEPEWPPSPLRVFQALVAAAAAHTNERNALTSAAPMLQWLEAQPAPLIIAPANARAAKYRLYVPDNVGDLVARSWRKGNVASIADYRTEKDVQPMRLIGGEAVHYLWPLPDGDAAFSQHRPLLQECARVMTHLGWGVDMVVANAPVISDEEAEQLSGQHWQPTVSDSRNVLRVPVAGTLEDLKRRHAAFLQRVHPDSFAPVPPLSKYRLMNYLASGKPPATAYAAFGLLTPNASGFRPFDPVRNGMRVAGMLRHAASSEALAAALGWPTEKMKRLVLGHSERDGEAHVPVDGPRLAFIPLPSIEAHGKGRANLVGSVRRVLVLGVRGANRDDLEQLARLITGQQLIDEHTQRVSALLSRLPNSDKMVCRYTASATTWATVTPLVLPGYDDPKKYRREVFHRVAEGRELTAERQKKLLGRLDRRIDFLIRKAVRQSGFSAQLARHAKIDWNNSGFWPGTDLASRYAIPDTLRRFRRLHVRITWRDAAGDPIQIEGPLCIGGGRFVGLGLFAPLGPQ